MLNERHYRKKLKEDLYYGGEVLIPKNRIITATLLRRAEKHNVLIADEQIYVDSEPFDESRSKDFEDLQELLNICVNMNHSTNVVRNIQRAEEIAARLRKIDLRNGKAPFLDWVFEKIDALKPF